MSSYKEALIYDPQGMEFQLKLYLGKIVPVFDMTILGMDCSGEVGLFFW